MSGRRDSGENAKSQTQYSGASLDFQPRNHLLGRYLNSEEPGRFFRTEPVLGANKLNHSTKFTCQVWWRRCPHGTDGVMGTQGCSLQISQSTLETGQRFPPRGKAALECMSTAPRLCHSPSQDPRMGLEPPGLVAGGGTGGAVKSLPTQSVLGFCDSKIPCRPSPAWSSAGMGSVSPVSL